MDFHARLLMATVVVVGVLFGGVPVAHAQIFSPGALAKPHTSLDGLTNCVKCHEPGNRLSNTRCLNCHTEIRDRVSSSDGFHGRLGKEQSCASCHREHKGESARLLDWGAAGKRAFDHGKTGYTLRGAHRPLDCKECHQKPRIDDDKILALIKKTGRSHTMLGLPNNCRDCHFDEHRAQLDKKCEKCHVEDAFKPARKFVHNRMTDFKLTGKHRRLNCKKCHRTKTDDDTPSDAFPKPASQKFLSFQDIDHNRCIDCHVDKHHRGTLGKSCEKCHTTDGWDRLRKDAKDIGFHEKTKFPLRGEHVNVDCASCHGPFANEKTPRWNDVPFERCADCHMDAHVGGLTRDDGVSPDCKSCHTVEQFTPAIFAIDRHQDTRFALEGGHRAVDCKLCHQPQKRVSRLVPKEVKLDRKNRDRPVVTSSFPMDIEGDLARCETCHQDPHGGQFPDVMTEVGCKSCHQASAFALLVFDHNTQSKFPLEGQHKNRDCRQCHVPDDVVKYRGVPMECRACHRDEHGGQFEKPHGARGPSAPASSSTSLRESSPTSTSQTSTSQTSTATTGVDCKTCHSVAGFTPSSFSHDNPLHTDFVLRGRHREIDCQRCHGTIDVVGREKPMTWYRGVPRECADCHADEHRGSFDGYTP